MYEVIHRISSFKAVDKPDEMCADFTKRNDEVKLYKNFSTLAHGLNLDQMIPGYCDVGCR